MDSSFILEQIVDNEITVVAKLNGDYFTLGREAEDVTIVVDHPSVSRQHGVIARFGSFWLYQDIGSTNGSWINGSKLIPNKWYLLRPCDQLVIADLLFSISEIDPKGVKKQVSDIEIINQRTLLVLKDGKFAGEFKVPDFGRALVIGGSSCDLELEGDLFEYPSLIAEKRGENVVVYSLAKEFPIAINGEEIEALTSLKDCDEVTLLNYTILYSEPSAVNAAAVMPETPVLSSKIKEWSESETVQFDSDNARHRTQEMRGSGLFGQAPVEDDDTFALPIRSSTDSKDDSFKTIEAVVLQIFGALIILAILGFLLMLLLSSK